ncbi:MAG: phosphoribosylamine---glycine ligase [Blastocatellia bacterium]|nr:phosphoribosylamine---glycine ligase [Blastocatellia bacterium]
MRILLIGSGGREHAIAWSLRSTSRRPVEIFCAPGNAGIAQIAECVPIQATNVEQLVVFAERELIDLTIVGGEAPLAAGIVDAFESRGLLIAGPSAAAAKLESSKVFAKRFMSRHGIPTARYEVATALDDAITILRSGMFGGDEAQVVVKADGLAGGKGVVVASSIEEAETAVRDMMIGGSVGKTAAESVVIEEALVGREASLLLFSDGMSFALMPAARDHKRIGENDTGPNTGGMGAVTSPDVMDEKTIRLVVREIVEPSLEGARKDGFQFRGILFIGLMLTADGPKVLEYNVRFGDPETQSILVRLRSDLAAIFEAVAHGTLAQTTVEWSDESSACVVLAAGGYPANPRTGDRIVGLGTNLARNDVHIFHAGTAVSAAGELVTAGGRVLGVTSSARSLDEALANCYAAIEAISWDEMQFRRDIGRFKGN